MLNEHRWSICFSDLEQLYYVLFSHTENILSWYISFYVTYAGKKWTSPKYSVSSSKFQTLHCTDMINFFMPLICISFRQTVFLLWNKLDQFPSKIVFFLCHVLSQFSWKTDLLSLQLAIVVCQTISLFPLSKTSTTNAIFSVYLK